MLGILLASCGNTKIPHSDTEAEQATEQVEQIPFEILLQDAHGGSETPENRVVTDESSLSAFYIQINRMRKPGFPLPEIDFGKEAVAILCLGQKTTSGYSVIVDRIEETSDQQIIWTKEISPQPTDMVAMVICQPFTIVKFPRTEKELVFKKVK